MNTLILLIQFWWEYFFNYQSDIISRIKNEDIPLKNPFIWPQNVSNAHDEIKIVEQQQSQGIINSSQAEEREMYIGSRRSCAQREAMEYLYRVQYRILRRVA